MKYVFILNTNQIFSYNNSSNRMDKKEAYMKRYNYMNKVRIKGEINEVEKLLLLASKEKSILESEQAKKDGTYIEWDIKYSTSIEHGPDYEWAKRCSELFPVLEITLCYEGDTLQLVHGIKCNNGKQTDMSKEGIAETLFAFCPTRRADVCGLFHVIRERIESGDERYILIENGDIMSKDIEKILNDNFIKKDTNDKAKSILMEYHHSWAKCFVEEYYDYMENGSIQNFEDAIATFD